MVREEILRSRYTEYKGSKEALDSKLTRKEVNDLNTVSKLPQFDKFLKK